MSESTYSASTERCPACLGHTTLAGGVLGKPRICPRCDGRGWVVKIEPPATQDEPVIHEKGLEEAALALMQANGGPGTPMRETARTAVEAYLRAVGRVPAGIQGGAPT